MDSLSGFIETYMAEYKQLKSNLGKWEEEIKVLLEKGQNDRQVSNQHKYKSDVLWSIKYLLFSRELSTKF